MGPVVDLWLALTITFIFIATTFIFYKKWKDTESLLETKNKLLKLEIERKDTIYKHQIADYERKIKTIEEKSNKNDEPKYILKEIPIKGTKALSVTVTTDNNLVIAGEPFANDEVYNKIINDLLKSAIDYIKIERIDSITNPFGVEWRGTLYVGERN